MKELIRQICIRLSILLMALLLGMPCSVKRNIKQLLDVPLSEATSMGHSTAPCTNVCTENSIKKVVDAGKKKHKPDTSGLKTNSSQEIVLHSLSTAPIEGGIIHPIPIYILHEQYLI